MPLTSEYLRQLEQALAAGNATEHTYRPALKAFVESLGGGIVATNEPKRVQYGAPDFVVTRGETPLGYIEAKDVGVSLEREEKGEQMARYLELGNVVLTDYLEFRWYVNRERRMTARLASKTRAGRLRAEPGGAEQVEELLSAFLEAQAATVGSPKELAVRMARIARLIRGNIRRALDAEDLTDEKPDPLHDQLASFREVLLHDLTEEQFADMYAQTICYGLFAARCNARGAASFTRDSAARLVPKTNPFLQKTFYQMVGPDLSPHVAWAVDDLVALLAHTDMAGILEDFGRRTRREDPVVHFYETFLAEYDPRLRETRGVYYTPEPVVSYIVRSVDHILKNDFKLRDGLADAGKVRVPRPDGGETEAHRVLILDPATGTGTFLFGAINHIYRTVGVRAKGAWPAYVAEELLPRLFGFELLMAPYTVAHLKLGLLLQETGVDLGKLGAETESETARLHVYLTNTLEEAHEMADALPFTRWLSEEANAASRVKRELPIMVVIGNPPYSGVAVNTGEWIETLMEAYKVTVREEERQIQRLSNDYVKFIRFAQWRLEQTGLGVLAFITDRGYLDGLLFRDMRRSLLDSFSDIYVLDLHGVAVRGSARANDRNVFDITQGVAISIFVKRNVNSKTKVVRHAEIIGSRESKYQILTTNDISTTAWNDLTPNAPHWLFVPSADSDAIYESWPPLLQSIGTGNPKADRDNRYGTGVKTRHDEFVIGWSPADAVQRVRRIAHRSEDDAVLMEELNLCTTAHFNIRSARKRAEKSDLTVNVQPISFRPFDIRFLVYLREFVCEPKTETMRHMLESDNIALAVLRRDRKELGSGYFVAKGLVAKDLVSNIDDALVWPLYVYESKAADSLFGDDEPTDAPGGRRPNLSEKFVAEFAARLGMRFVADGKGDRAGTFGPEDVFAYMYAVFHSPEYRSRYAEFLKIDFPRLPLTSDAELFRALCRAGDELVALHLLEKDPPHVTDYPNAGANEVEQVRYTAPGEAGGAEGRVWINREQFFAGVAPEVWGFHVGGYQVASKWLKDRKGRRLTYEDVTHYQRVVAALGETLRLMSEIDDAIGRHRGWPLQ